MNYFQKHQKVETDKWRTKFMRISHNARALKNEIFAKVKPQLSLTKDNFYMVEKLTE